MHFMTTTGIILLVAYVAFVVGSFGYTIGFLHGISAKYNEHNELYLWKQWIRKPTKSKRTA